MPTFEREGITLSFGDEGQGAPVLLLHPFPLRGETFRPQIDALRSRARLVFPDQRGFGASGSGDALVTTMETMAKDMFALLDHLAIARAIVCGCSMGGYVAMAMLRLAPHRVSGLVLLGPNADADDAKTKEGRETTASKIASEGARVLVEGPTSMLPKLLAAPEGAHAEAVRAMIATNGREGLAAAMRGLGAREASHDVLAAYHGPTLLVAGGRDVPAPPEKARALAKAMRQAELVEIPDAGHLVYLEAAEVVNVHLARFIAGA